MTDFTMVSSEQALPGIERFWPRECPVARMEFGFDKPLGFVRAVERQIPRDRPGIYVFRDETGAPIYVGKAICLRKRLLCYARGTEAGPPGKPLPKEARILLESRSTTIGPCLDELGALVWERELIATWKPRWNRSHNLPLRRWLWLTRKRQKMQSLPSSAKKRCATGESLRPFQMKALKPADTLEAWGPFRGGRWTSALKRALNTRIPELSQSDQETLALAYLNGQDRTFLRIWESHIAKLCESTGVSVLVENEVRDGDWDAGPLEQYQALLSFEKWRVKAARSKTLSGYCPIAPQGGRSWNCSLPPGSAYFYFLQEGRILGAIQSSRHHPLLPAALPREFFVRGVVQSRGLDEPFMVSQWLDRFPACAQSFVFAQTTLFSNSADLA